MSAHAGVECTLVAQVARNYAEEDAYAASEVAHVLVDEYLPGDVRFEARAQAEAVLQAALLAAMEAARQSLAHTLEAWPAETVLAALRPHLGTESDAAQAVLHNWILLTRARAHAAGLVRAARVQGVGL